VGRAAALLALTGALVAWYEVAPHLDGWRLWPSILLISLVLMPACFLTCWLALPLWRDRWLPLAASALILLAVALSSHGWPVGSNF
jgi:hypothetical protein